MAQRKPERMSDDELFRDWTAALERIKQEMYHLGHNRRIFRLVRGIANDNHRVRDTGGHVLDWMFGNYVLAAGMMFRRDVDRDQSTVNLLNLLYELGERPQVVNRGRYRALWGDTDRHPERMRCDRAFDSFEPIRHPGEPERDHADPEKIARDRDELLRDVERVRSYVERTMAHRAREAPLPVTWAEFDAALDSVINLFIKYHALVTQNALDTVEPVPQYNERECFTFPWIEPGDRHGRTQ
jgi:hypothetical protein